MRIIFKNFIKSIRFKSLFDKKEPGDCERIFKLKFGGMEATKYLSFYAANQNWKSNRSQNVCTTKIAIRCGVSK